MSLIWFLVICFFSDNMMQLALPHLAGWSNAALRPNNNTRQDARGHRAIYSKTNPKKDRNSARCVWLPNRIGIWGPRQVIGAACCFARIRPWLPPYLTTLVLVSCHCNLLPHLTTVYTIKNYRYMYIVQVVGLNYNWNLHHLTSIKIPISYRPG